MSGCGFESIHSCYVRRLRVVLRNVSARYCFKHFLFPWVHFLQTRSDSGRWVVDFFLHTSIKMKFHWNGSTRPFQQESPWRIVEIKANMYDFPVHVNSIEISAYFKNLFFTKDVNNFKLFYRKIHYLTREFHVKLHAKTDIARIAKRWVRYRFSSAI